MGCCLFAIVLAGAPRLALFFWWLMQRAYVTLAFKGGQIWGLLGFLFLPWTTLMWVIVYPGGISFVNWIFLGLAFAIDMGTYFGGGREAQTRYAS
jgi:hypothetical protein